MARERLIAGIAAAAVAVIVALGLLANHFAGGDLKREAIAELERRYDASVSYSELKVRVFPEISVEGRDFDLRKHDRPGESFIHIARFSARAGLLRVLFQPRHVTVVRLDGLDIRMPRQQEGSRPRRSRPSEEQSPVIVDRIVSKDARVVILPAEAEKAPLIFDVHKLEMRDVGLGRASPFSARLSNPKPPGEIRVTGTFGPWRRDEPRLTPVAARYSFEHADLGVFRGIAGILASTGRFAGPLERLNVEGETRTPDFLVRRSGHPVNLETRYHAVVDGTNGDTELQPVDAHFLQTALTARGNVVKRAGEPGRTVQLDVVVEHGRVEDLIRLATPADEPVLTGPVAFHTSFLLPPGEGDVMDRLQLAGEFTVGPARFTKLDLQEKVRSLSRKGQGEPESPEAGSDVSNLHGHFRLRDGVLAFDDLQFEVPGAGVRMAGTYGLRDEALNFQGYLRLAQPISKTTTGVKSFFLKLVQPLFKGPRGGSIIPIRVGGTRAHPDFGLDLGRAMTPGR